MQMDFTFSNLEISMTLKDTTSIKQVLMSLVVFMTKMEIILHLQILLLLMMEALFT